MILAGIDYSLTSPGICIYNLAWGKFNFKNTRHYFSSSQKRFELYNEHGITAEGHQPYVTEEERFNDIALWAMNKLVHHGVEKAFLEGYAFAAKGKVFNIAENTGLLKHFLWNAQIDFKIVPPTTVKKFATGKGNTNKDGMYEAFSRENPDADLHGWLTPRASTIISPVSDIVDAYYLVKYGVETDLDGT